jgi:N-acyl-D-amino-acid deacylase
MRQTAGGWMMASVLLAGVACQAQTTYDVVLRNGRIVDGTGAPWYRGDVAIRAGKIVAIGKLEGAAAPRTIDVRGMVIAPGFIDMMGQPRRHS